MRLLLSIYLRRYPFSLLTVLLITALSLLPIGSVEIAKDVPFADKWTHMVMYGILTLVIWVEYLRHHRRIQRSRLILFAFIAPIAMSGLMELLQAYATTYRSGEWLDLAANSTGVCLGTAIGYGLFLLRRKTAKPAPEEQAS